MKGLSGLWPCPNFPCRILSVRWAQCNPSMALLAFSTTLTRRHTGGRKHWHKLISYWRELQLRNAFTTSRKKKKYGVHTPNACVWLITAAFVCLLLFFSSSANRLSTLTVCQWENSALFCSSSPPAPPTTVVCVAHAHGCSSETTLADRPPTVAHERARAPPLSFIHSNCSRSARALRKWAPFPPASRINRAVSDSSMLQYEGRRLAALHGVPDGHQSVLCCVRIVVPFGLSSVLWTGFLKRCSDLHCGL